MASLKELLGQYRNIRTKQLIGRRQIEAAHSRCSLACGSNVSDSDAADPDIEGGHICKPCISDMQYWMDKQNGTFTNILGANSP